MFSFVSEIYVAVFFFFFGCLDFLFFFRFMYMTLFLLVCEYKLYTVHGRELGIIIPSN